MSDQRQPVNYTTCTRTAHLSEFLKANTRQVDIEQINLSTKSENKMLKNKPK